jgi:hypothetical protein
VKGEPVSRSEVIGIARAYAEHQWQPSEANSFHGHDRKGITVETPDAPVGNFVANFVEGFSSRPINYGWNHATPTRF